MSFTLHDQIVSCCGNCPNNKAFPNGFLSHPIFKYLPLAYNVLPETHRCVVSLDTVLLDKDGRLIMNPNSIPSWCPFEP